MSHHTDISKNTKTWAVSQHTDTSEEHQGLICVTTYCHQQEHQGLGCQNTQTPAHTVHSREFYTHVLDTARYFNAVQFNNLHARNPTFGEDFIYIYITAMQI